MPSNHFILCHPLLLCLQFFPASGSFPVSHSLHQVAKILELQPQHQSFQWIFRIGLHYNWLVWSPCSPKDPQESFPAHSSKISIIWCSAFFIVQLASIPDYWKNHSFDYMDFVSKVMFLLFNTLSRLAVAFLPRSKHLLISWLQSPSAVIWSPRK